MSKLAVAKAITRRIFVIIVLVGMVVFALILENGSEDSSVEQVAQPIGFAAPATAISSVWYCPLTAAQRDDPNSGLIFVLNVSPNTLGGKITFYPEGQSAPVEVPMSVSPDTRATFKASEFINSRFAAVLVSVDGAGATVEHTYKDANGESIAPCVNSVSSNLHFAYGNTLSDTSMFISLFNPFAQDAIADVRMVTNEGGTQPPGFQGVVVPARSVSVLNVSEQVRRREWIAGSVQVRSGRLLADELITGNIVGVNGNALLPLVPEPSNTWHFPDGFVAPGAGESVILYNPNHTESEVRVDVIREDGQDIVSFDLRVPANGRIELNLDVQVRIVQPARFSVDATSTNNVPVVVVKASRAITPTEYTGASVENGSPVQAKKWVITGGDTFNEWDQSVEVSNTSDADADIQVILTGEKKTYLVPDKIHLVPNQRATIRIDDLTNTASGVIIESTSEVVAGARSTIRPGPSLSQRIGIPLR